MLLVCIMHGDGIVMVKYVMQLVCSINTCCNHCSVVVKSILKLDDAT